jgi:hemoglobin-like flavoprotein
MKGVEEEIVLLMMPVYFIPNVEVTSRDVTSCQNSWNLIIDDESAAYKAYKSSTDQAHPTCIIWFSHVFYERLFNIHPLCRPLFTKGVESVGAFLVQMVSMSLSQLRDPTKFQQTMTALAARHCERGVKASEYGTIGEVLFYSLRKCLGEEAYNPTVETAWKKIYSSMLRIIVPLVVTYERTGKLVSAGSQNSSEAEKRKQT